jgi:virginiamycin A acetyltransferase
MLKAPGWFAITPPMIDLLRARRIFSGRTGVERLAVGQKLRIPEEASLEAYSNLLTDFVLPGSIGAFSYSQSRLHWLLEIGRYCSIAPGVGVMGSAHPTDWASTSPFSYNPGPVGSIAGYLGDVGAHTFILRRFDQGPQPVTIGHDVWVGADVVLKRGISIGTGAVIAARSIVTRDVPPYAIVGGAPARLIRHRFAQPLIDRLLASEWWNYGPDVLQPLDISKPEPFLDKLDAAKAAGAETLKLGHLTGKELIALA